MKKLLILLSAMLGISGYGCARGNQGITDVDAEGFASILKEGNVQLVDVRTPEEYAEGHIAGAVNINVFDTDFVTEAEDSLKNSEPVAVYCRSGKRSADAAHILAAKGYKVINLEGGIMAWIKADEPVVK